MTDLTDKQLQYAKWYLRHKKNIRRGIILVLIFLNIILITFTTYKTVVYFKTKEEHLNNMLGLTKNRIDFLALHQHFAPQLIVTDSLTVICPDPKKSQYDLVITAFSPNSDWQATVEYYFLVNELETFAGSGFINPGEKKYFYVLGSQITSEITDVQFIFSNVSWRRVRPEQKYYLSILDQLNVENIDLKYLQAEDESLVLPQISFEIKNNSIYDFWETNFVIALERDLNLVGLNIFLSDSLYAGEEKKITFVWPLIPQFSHIIVKPEINVLNSEVFISPL